MIWDKNAPSLLKECFISYGDHPCGSWGHFLHALHNGGHESDWVSKNGDMSHGELDGCSASEGGSSGGSDLLGYQEPSKKKYGFWNETLPKVLSSYLKSVLKELLSPSNIFPAPSPLNPQGCEHTSKRGWQLWMEFCGGHGNSWCRWCWWGNLASPGDIKDDMIHAHVRSFQGCLVAVVQCPASKVFWEDHYGVQPTWCPQNSEQFRLANVNGMGTCRVVCDGSQSLMTCPLIVFHISYGAKGTLII